MSKRVKIDIVIGFNDVEPPPNICFVPGSKPTYYKQLLYLLHSINKNWNKDIYDYQTYAFHSRYLPEDKKQKIESLGCKVVYEPREMQPYINRAEIFNYETDGDYTLLLDSDMILLNTPKLDFEKELMGFYLSGHPLLEYSKTLEKFSNYDFSEKNEDLERIKIGGQN